MATLEHVITSGQSLSVGSQGTPSISTVTENADALLVNPTTGALTELKSSTAQRPDLTMGYRLADHVPGQKFGLSTHGLSGQSIAQLSPGGSSGRYEQAIACITAARDSRIAAGQTYRVRAVHWIQGEADQTFNTSAADYTTALVDLIEAYRTDIEGLTGQVDDWPFIMSQTATWAYYGNAARIGLAQLEAARDLPGVYLIGGQYQLPYYEGLHLTAEGYYKLGELHARAHNAIMDGGSWLPFAPIGYTVGESEIVIEYNVPSGSLTFDTVTVAAQDHYGFSLSGSSAVILGAAVTGPSEVTLTTSQHVYEASAAVGYGVTTGTGPGLGNLRDSETAVSGYDGARLANWAAHSLDNLGLTGPSLTGSLRVTGAYLAGPGGRLWAIEPPAAFG